MFDLLDNPAINQLSAAVHFAQKRHELIVNNIANVATPGYHARDLDVESFESVMSRYRRDGEADFGEAYQEIDSPDAGPEKANGNNVNIDREMTKLSSNALLSEAMLALLHQQIGAIRSALAEHL